MTRRGSYAKGLAKREEILDAALEVVAREGYRGTSVREISAASGLSQAGLMHHFASKDELFTEILRRRDEIDMALIASDPDIRALEAFPLAIKHNTEVPGLVHLYVCFSAEATAPQHVARAFFIERFARLQELLVEDIRARQATGELPVGLNAQSAAGSLIAMADGLQTQWLLNPNIDMAAHVIETISSWRKHD
ncbi:TetR family transcriptional regulator [Arthrobacter sp. MYb227]|uniref:TetR/AcrR family transcriptional regulator n=1 Tax=Arthrobacter sp. MYb227 TaxID=1848601 RepID=UPI000CFCD8A0|nr:TetR family transcriptional regulator [Arthrobacter sp. MYb227]PQZ94839.1 TetR family transcriptional regulator [Arthrobacter sp. MYb227]